MQKAIYICLMTLFFSFSSFADSFNEYDDVNYPNQVYISGFRINDGTPSGGATAVSKEIARVQAMGTNAYLYMSKPPTKDYYVGTGGNTKNTGTGFDTAKSILEYQYKPGDVIQMFPLMIEHRDSEDGPVTSTEPKLDSNGNLQYGFIVSNSGQSTFQLSPPDYTLQQANTGMMNIFVSEPTRPYFSYNIYNTNNNSVTESIYKATPSGPVIVKSRELRAYSNIPRIVKDNPNFAPGSPFSIATSIYSSTSTQYSLYDGYRVIRDYLDYTSPDDVVPGNNGLGMREKAILDIIPKIREGLPDDLKPDAEYILEMYIEQCDANPDIHPAQLMNEILESPKVDDIVLPSNLPFIDGKNYVFDSNGYPKEAGEEGDLVQIEVNGVKKLPSELNIKVLHKERL